MAMRQKTVQTPQSRTVHRLTVRAPPWPPSAHTCTYARALVDTGTALASLRGMRAHGPKRRAVFPFAAVGALLCLFWPRGFTPIAESPKTPRTSVPLPEALQALFFATPVLLLPAQVGRFRVIMDLNPLSYHLDLFRCALYGTPWPSPMAWGVAIGSSLVSLGIGYLVFKWHENVYIFRL